MTDPPPDDASAELEKMRTLAATDGNAFHARVATYFRSRGWRVLLSPYYVDNATGQAREIDLLCEHLFPFSINDRSNGHGILRIQLFVECKYIKGPVLFWFDERDHERTDLWLAQRTPFTGRYARSQGFHHYVNSGTHVAKLFRSSTEGNDPIYKGLSQSLGALIQRRDAAPLETLDRTYGASEMESTIQYPVIVCSDSARFYRTDIDSPGDAVLAPDRFQLEVDYAYTKKGRVTEEYFLIDVVRFAKLDSFLDVLRREIDEAVLLLAN